MLQPTLTDNQIYNLVLMAKEYSNIDSFVSNAVSLTKSGDKKNIEDYHVLWKAVNLPFNKIRAAMGLTQEQMAIRLCIPKRTVQNWEYRECCPIHVRLLMARVWTENLY